MRIAERNQAGHELLGLAGETRHASTVAIFRNRKAVLERILGYGGLVRTRKVSVLYIQATSVADAFALVCVPLGLLPLVLLALGVGLDGFRGAFALANASVLDLEGLWSLGLAVDIWIALFATAGVLYEDLVVVGAVSRRIGALAGAVRGGANLSLELFVITLVRIAPLLRLRQGEHQVVQFLFMSQPHRWNLLSLRKGNTPGSNDPVPP